MDNEIIKENKPLKIPAKPVVGSTDNTDVIVKAKRKFTFVGQIYEEGETLHMRKMDYESRKQFVTLVANDTGTEEVKEVEPKKEEPKIEEAKPEVPAQSGLKMYCLRENIMVVGQRYEKGILFNETHENFLILKQYS